MSKKIEHVEAILYHKIQDSDFTNMYGVKKPIGGGGQTYIQAAGYVADDLDKMFKEANAADTPEYWDSNKRNNRKRYNFPAFVVGKKEQEKELELAPRTGRKDYRISRQNPAHRHPAWKQENGFPAPEKNASGEYIYDKGYPGKIDHLYIMIIKTRTSNNEVRYYASYVDSRYIPETWPKGVGLESIFSGKRQGIIFYDQQFLRFTNILLKPFSVGSAIDELLGNVKLPEDLTESVDDAIEYAKKEIDFSIDILGVEFSEEPAPKGKRRTSVKSGSKIEKDKNYIRRQKNLKKVGDLGEELVVEMEKRRLVMLGRKDLAKRIKHASKEVGDGLGYDIESFNVEGKNVEVMYIEVKTTTGGINKPFDVSANEVEVSSKIGDKYYIYRLYGLCPGATNISYYVVKGSIANNFNLTPTGYKAYTK
jgi:hypothetical protein